MSVQPSFRRLRTDLYQIWKNGKMVIRLYPACDTYQSSGRRHYLVTNPGLEKRGHPHFGAPSPTRDAFLIFS